MRRAFAIEVGFAAIGLIRKITSTFDYNCAHRSAFAFLRRHRWRSFSTAHLRALLFQDCLAREADTVTFHRQHLHQDLIAFLQFITDIRDAMLGYLANMQQSIGTGNDLDERTEVGQSRNFAQVGLSYLGGRRNIANNLQCLGR